MNLNLEYVKSFLQAKYPESSLLVFSDMSCDKTYLSGSLYKHGKNFCLTQSNTITLHIPKEYEEQFKGIIDLICLFIKKEPSLEQVQEGNINIICYVWW